jgi:hypothetical protein
MIGRGEDADAAPGVQDQQVGVAGDNGVRAGGQREFEVDVVLWVTAIADRIGRDEANASRDHQMLDFIPKRFVHEAGEAGAGENMRQLRDDRLGESDPVARKRPAQGAFWHRVAADRSADKGRDVKDDQSGGDRRSRRSAL